MGMAASQARLLSLTGRQLDVELRAQVLQARKLQLDNNSKQIYNDYMEALDNSFIKYRFTNSLGEAEMRDVSLNGLQNGLVGAYGASDKVMFLQSIGGNTLFVTPTVNDKYDLIGVSNGDYSNLNEYLEKTLGADAFAKVNFKNETTIKTPSNLSEVLKVKTFESFTSVSTGGDVYTIDRGYRAAGNVQELAATSVNSVIINNREDLAKYFKACTEAYNQLFGDYESYIALSKEEQQARVDSYNKLLSMDLIVSDFGETFCEYWGADPNLVAAFEAFNALKEEAESYGIVNIHSGEVYYLDANDNEQYVSTYSDTTSVSGHYDYVDYAPYYFTNSENCVFKNAGLREVADGRLYFDFKRIDSNLNFENLVVNLDENGSSYSSSIGSDRTGSGTFTKTISADNLYNVVAGTTDSYYTTYNPKLVCDAINLYNKKNGISGSVTEEELYTFLFGHDDFEYNLEGPLVSNALLQLNKSCELYMASQAGNLDDCIEFYDNIELSDQFEDMLLRDADIANFFDVMFEDYNSDYYSITEYKNGENAEALEDAFDKFFEELNKNIALVCNNPNNTEGMLGLSFYDRGVDYYHPKTYTYYDEPSFSSLNVGDTYSYTNANGNSATDTTPQEVLNTRDMILDGIIPSAIYTKSETTYGFEEVPVCNIPSEYTLANNIYMALVNYSLRNDSVEDMDYNEVEKYKEIYTKIQGLDINTQYKIQYLIEQDTKWAQYDVEPDGIVELYNYFEGDGTVPASFATVADLEADKRVNRINEEDISQSGSIEDVAKRYFAHYSESFGRQQTYTIDSSNVEVQKAIAMYKLGSSYSNIEVTSESLASDTEYVNDMIKNAAGVLLTVDTAKVAATEYTYITEDSSWVDDEKEKAKGLQEITTMMSNKVVVEDVNVATSTYLEKVLDSAKANEAQAIYESEMAKINVKESRIDTELTALEAERQVIKTAQESIKKVAKENIELSFKLFS